jgi:hypothetical protein
MGVQNLFKNLYAYNKIIKNDILLTNNTIFLDFSSIAHAMLHVSENENDCVYRMTKYFDKLKENNNIIYVFLDSGTINIKKKEREYREQNNLKKIKFFQNKLQNIKINKYNPCACVDKEIELLNFKINILNNDYVKSIFSKIIDNINNKCIIFKKKNIDAEFYLCSEYINFINKDFNKETCIISNDQDTILLLLNNIQLDTINIKYKNNIYKLIIDNISKNISILSILFNKSDYFKIKNYMYDEKKINIEMLDMCPEYDYLYIIKICKILLKDKKINKKSIPCIPDCDIIKYINQVNKYIKIDYTIYEENIIYDINIQHILRFIFNEYSKIY